MKQVERYETVIVGGGQAGLSVGYHLKQQGHSFVILDASERIGDSWRNRWDSLRLYSPAFRDGLPGMPFPAPRTTYPTKDEMGDYLEAYATRFELPVRERRGRRGADEGERPLRRDRRRPALRGRQRRRRHGRLQEAVHARVRGRARSEHHPAPLAATTATCRSCRTGRCSSSARATRARTSPTRRRRHTTSSSRARTPGRSPCRSRAGADGSASGCSCSSARTSSTSTRRWAGRCARTSGTAAARSSATARRTCSRQESSACSRARSASSTAGRCSTTAASSTCGTSSGAPASGPTSAGFASRSRSGEDGYPVQYRGAVASSPGLYFAGLPFLHSFASMLIAGSGKGRRAGRAPHPGRARAAARREAGRARARNRVVTEDVLVWNGRVADPSPAKPGWQCELRGYRDDRVDARFSPAGGHAALGQRRHAEGGALAGEDRLHGCLQGGCLRAAPGAAD